MLIAISLALAVLCLAVAVWAVFSGELGTMDGILLLAVCLTLALIFSLNARSMIRSDTFRNWLKRRKEKGGNAQEKQARSS